MTENFHFDGTIKNVRYNPQLTCDLAIYESLNFNVNAVAQNGIIKLSGNNIYYSIWESPVATKTSHFAGVYKTCKPAHMRILIIPVMKDDGLDGLLEFIQYSTLSWMNLANVYIVLSLYESAEGTKANSQRLVKQQLNSDIVNQQLEELASYQSSAIHWNRFQFGERFKKVFKKAIHEYEKISKRMKVKVHSTKTKLEYIDKMRDDCRKYEGISIDGLKSYDIKKDRNLHQNKYEEGQKSTFYLIDGYGGIYYLTAKDIWRGQDIYVIQETRYSNKNFLPSLEQIQDGLFRLIFFGNIDALYRNGHQIKFQTRLSLFGKGIQGELYLPCDDKTFRSFIKKNKNLITSNEMDILSSLKAETEINQGLIVEIRERQ